MHKAEELLGDSVRPMLCIKLKNRSVIQSCSILSMTRYAMYELSPRLDKATGAFAAENQRVHHNNYNG